MTSGSVRVLWDAAETAQVTITGGTWKVGGNTVTFPYSLTTSTTFVADTDGAYSMSVTLFGVEIASTPDGTRTFNLKSGSELIFAPSIDSVPSGASGNEFLGNMDAIAAGIAEDENSDLRGVLSAAIDDVGTTLFAKTDGVPTLVKGLGDSRAGVLDWEFGAGAPGYLLHFRAGTNSVSTEYAFAVGTDAGSGGGYLASLKNANGVGFRVDQHPGAGVGISTTNKGPNPAQYTDLYVGGGGEMVGIKSGAGFSDGVVTGTTAQLTSASAAFVSGDIGATVTAEVPTATAFATAASPGNTVLTITAVSAGVATLSGTPNAARTGIRFTLSGRLPATSQPIYRVFDTDSGSALLYDFRKGYAKIAVPFIAMDAATVPLIAKGAASQTADLFQVQDSGGIQHVKVTNLGKLFSAYSTQLNNAADATQTVAVVRNYGTTSGAPSLVVYQNVAADMQRWITNDGNTILSRVNKNGVYMTQVSTVPADADLVTGELALWFDKTAGAAKLMIKAKNASGTVVTGSVALA